ncbi:MAG: hypothetical protein MN733_02065, partial [Nitrososphaera sp.]|nr:hypothetical protein [Nitrososphaera sp.]
MTKKLIHIMTLGTTGHVIQKSLRMMRILACAPRFRHASTLQPQSGNGVYSISTHVLEHIECLVHLIPSNARESYRKVNGELH